MPKLMIATAVDIFTNNNAFFFLLRQKRNKKGGRKSNAPDINRSGFKPTPIDNHGLPPTRSLDSYGNDKKEHIGAKV